MGNFIVNVQFNESVDDLNREVSTLAMACNLKDSMLDETVKKVTVMDKSNGVMLWCSHNCKFFQTLKQQK